MPSYRVSIFISCFNDDFCMLESRDTARAFGPEFFRLRKCTSGFLFFWGGEEGGDIQL